MFSMCYMGHLQYGFHIRQQYSNREGKQDTFESLIIFCMIEKLYVKYEILMKYFPGLF